MSLSYADLFSSGTPQSPVDDAQFAPLENAAAPSDSFEGRLELLNTSGNGTLTSLVDDGGTFSRGDSPWRHLPPFSFEFVQDGTHLIPAQQGLVQTGSQAWNYIVGPGRVWQQSDDSGYMRASFPFALVQRNQNCIHNGVMLFLFSNSKSPRISNVRYQVTQETCAYAKFNLWGQIAATYTPGSVANAATIKTAHAYEVAHRLPTKPLSALGTDFPGSGINSAGLISSFRYPEDITLYGIFVNGTNYVSGCQTRFGQYAYCSEMRVPSYSIAKSAFASVAAMRLGQLYGPEVYSQLIRDYVPEHTNGGDWSTVTLNNGLDMATGNYLSSAYMSDTNSREDTFLLDETYSAKIYNAFHTFPHQALPGTVWVYQNAASFITTQAMNGFLQQRQGNGADIFNFVRDDVYKPLGISQGGLTMLRTDNSPTGKPFGFMGLFLIQDDVAKIGKLLNNDEGVIDGVQVLDSGRLRESLFRDPNSLGLPVPDTGTPAVPNSFRYHNYFWAKHATAAEFPQLACDVWIPYMSGWGGNTVALMPNGATFYVFSDHGEANWFVAANEANKLTPFCSNTN